MSTNESVLVEAKRPMSDAVQLAIKFENSKSKVLELVHVNLPSLQ